MIAMPMLLQMRLEDALKEAIRRRQSEGICRHVARVRSLRLPGRHALAHSASTYISAACMILWASANALWCYCGASTALRCHDGALVAATIQSKGSGDLEMTIQIFCSRAENDRPVHLVSGVNVQK